MSSLDEWPEIYLSMCLIAKHSPERINNTLVGCRSRGVRFIEVFLRHCLLLYLEILYPSQQKRTHKSRLDSSPVLLAYLSQWGSGGAWSTQYICRLSSRACCIWFVSEWHQKHQAERKGCCGCSEAQHPQPLPLVAHTFISNTAGVLMRTGGIVMACSSPPLWVLCGHGWYSKPNHASYP